MINFHPIPIFDDNYVWVISKEDKTSVYVVDPGDAKPVLQYLKTHQLELAGILITHRHPDHIGGIKKLLKWQTTEVKGPVSSFIPQVTDPVEEGAQFSLWGEFLVNVMATPGHTTEHICYLIHDDQERHLLCGDTLFSSGCGRLLGGTAEQLKASLDRLSTLPPQTKIYCAHEYTTANLNFALAVEPNNDAMQQRLDEVKTLRTQNQPSLPSTIGRELLVNPFLRYKSPDVANNIETYAHLSLDQTIPESLRQEERDQILFSSLRKWKDNF